MQGYVLTRYGDARAMELREVPEPTAGDGEEFFERLRHRGEDPQSPRR